MSSWASTRRCLAPACRSVVGRLRYAVPQWRADLRAGLERARARLSQVRIDGIDWYWPAGERPRQTEPDDAVRLLCPFDPVVWDRRRFELLWDWAYRFEAYTPADKRKLGYYALPLLWRDQVIGWANVSWRRGALHSDIGYIGPRAPSDRRFNRALAAELQDLERFLAAPPGD